MEITTLIVLGLVGLLAGGIDAIAGGGGLLTLPALLSAGVDPALALGTNKGQSVFGSFAALVRYARSPLLDRRRALGGFIAGFCGSVGGVLLVQYVPTTALRPLLVVMLLMAAMTVLLVRPRPAGEGSRPLSRPMWQWLVVGVVMGGYDGFFGPGTGTFLIIVGVWWWGRSYEAASADAKAVNCASNLGAVLVFAWLGLVWWLPALVMASGALVGGWCGAHLVLTRGQGLVRGLAVTVSLLLAGKVAWDLWR